MSQPRASASLSSYVSNKSFMDQELSDAPYKIMQYPSCPFVTGVTLTQNPLVSSISPKGILCFDVDETLLNYWQTRLSGRLSLINPEKIENILKKAKENNIIVMVITARAFENPYDLPHPLNIMATLEKLGLHYFNTLFFTNANHKFPVLNLLNAMYFEDSTKSLSKISLVDDSLEILGPCKMLGFNAIHVEDNYLDKINEFLDRLVNPIASPSEEKMSASTSDIYKKLPDLHPVKQVESEKVVKVDESLTISAPVEIQDAKSDKPVFTM
jgi:hydroxymethylpyrimidine pyrophosphatase-like HAD family hydrolase